MSVPAALHSATLRGDQCEVPPHYWLRLTISLQVRDILAADRAAVNLPDDSGFIALHLAVRANHFDMARLLLEHGASAEDNNNIEFMTPLQLAYVVGDERMIQLLWRFSEELLEPPSSSQSPVLEESPPSAHQLEEGAPQLISWDGFGEGHWEYLKWQCETNDIPQVTLTAQLAGSCHHGLRLFVRWRRPPTLSAHDQESAGADSSGEHQIVIESPVSDSFSPRLRSTA